jgi:hypothetical protein
MSVLTPGCSTAVTVGAVLSLHVKEGLVAAGRNREKPALETLATVAVYEAFWK